MGLYVICRVEFISAKAHQKRSYTTLLSSACCKVQLLKGHAGIWQNLADLFKEFMPQRWHIKKTFPPWCFNVQRLKTSSGSEPGEMCPIPCRSTIFFKIVLECVSSLQFLKASSRLAKRSCIIAHKLTSPQPPSCDGRVSNKSFRSL